MKAYKFLLSNLFIGIILGVILSGPFFVIWNLLASQFSFGSVDIITALLIMIPLSMAGMAFALRDRNVENDKKTSTYNNKKK